MHNIFLGIAYAAENPAVTSVVQKINQFIVNPLIGFLFALAFVVFLWGTAQFVFQADNEAAHTQGKQHMIWGIIGMVIMFGAFTIMSIIGNTIGAPVPGLP